MKIGLTYTSSQSKHYNYHNWLTQGNNSIEIITLSAAKANLQELLKCNGLVLSGGVDITPSIYSKNDNYPEKPTAFELERDEFEIACFKLAQQNNLPVLGICRGLQLINCIMGGTLLQDLGYANLVHKAIIKEQQFDKVHALHILPNNYLSDLLKTDRAIVNSAHHQAVDTIANDLTATCFSDDGIVEGLEWKDKSDKPFLLCIQWHPERMYEFQLGESPLSMGVRNKFIEACKSIKINYK
jgi:putative glutamine amidotransferase